MWKSPTRSRTGAKLEESVKQSADNSRQAVISNCQVIAIITRYRLSLRLILERGHFVRMYKYQVLVDVPEYSGIE